MFTGEGAQLTEEPKWSEEQIKVYVSFVEKTLETWECPLPKNMKGCNLETEDMPVSPDGHLVHEAYPDECVGIRFRDAARMGERRA